MSMSEHEKLASYSKAILTATPARSESVCSKIADSFEDDLLELEGFPVDYFSFVLQLFSEPNFYNRPGIWNFLLVLGTEGHKLEKKHYDDLAKTLLSNYLNYLDRDLCLATCDFIARNYTTEKAKEILNKFLAVEHEKDVTLRGFADEGLYILGREVERNRKSSD
jgi:hypothetical protein